MSKQTVVNYTPEQTEKMVFDYKAGVAVEVIAAEIGKSVRSVVAKLSREGVYVAKSGKTGDKSGKVTKSELVAKIAEKIGVPAEKLESLEKATKEALELLAA